MLVGFERLVDYKLLHGVTQAEETLDGATAARPLN